MADDIAILGTNASAPFSLRVHRGDGMVLLGMDWRDGPHPPDDFVGFSIQYRPPDHQAFFSLSNRLSFARHPANVGTNPRSSLFAPIQKFRWVHFPFDAELPGAYRYRVRPAFMDASRTITWGEEQVADVVLGRETWPGLLNVAYTRGFVSSQAFVDRYASAGKISTLLPGLAKDGLDFQPTHPKTAEALAWMGFEARDAILDLLDAAIADGTAQVRVVAYDLNEPAIVSRLERLGTRLRVIVDDSDDHGAAESAETAAAARLRVSAGAGHVKRQRMGKLQHNKTIVVEGDAVTSVACGSTNFSWRGLYVQANNALVIHGATAARVFHEAFNDYWFRGTEAAFEPTDSTRWRDLGLGTLDARVSFSPHGPGNPRLDAVGADIDSARSSVFYSLAFLAQTSGAVRDAVKRVTENPKVFVYGMADKEIGGIDLQKPDGNIAPVRPEVLTAADVPEPFKSEPVGGSGTRLHHKFVVLDFERPTARVYTGSYNFSPPADGQNGENLVRIRDRRVATSYMVEALRLFDHYHFRVKQLEASSAHRRLLLRDPPKAGELAWWADDFSVPIKIRDRKLFS